jgi:hypothetical protein
MRAAPWFVSLMMTLTVVLRSGVGRAEGRPLRAALVVRNNLGEAHDGPLRYAERMPSACRIYWSS